MSENIATEEQIETTLVEFSKLSPQDRKNVLDCEAVNSLPNGERLKAIWQFLVATKDKGAN